MATRYAGKYRRSSCPQATIKHLTSCCTYHWGETFWRFPGQVFFLCWGTTLFTGGRCPPSPPTLHTVLNQLQICSAEKNTLKQNVEILAVLF